MTFPACADSPASSLLQREYCRSTSARAGTRTTCGEKWSGSGGGTVAFVSRLDHLCGLASGRDVDVEDSRQTSPDGLMYGDDARCSRRGVAATVGGCWRWSDHAGRSHGDPSSRKAAEGQAADRVCDIRPHGRLGGSWVVTVTECALPDDMPLRCASPHAVAAVRLRAGAASDGEFAMSALARAEQRVAQVSPRCVSWSPMRQRTPHAICSTRRRQPAPAASRVPAQYCLIEGNIEGDGGPSAAVIASCCRELERSCAAGPAAAAAPVTHRAGASWQ